MYCLSSDEAAVGKWFPLLALIGRRLELHLELQSLWPSTAATLAAMQTLLK